MDEHESISGRQAREDADSQLCMAIDCLTAGVGGVRLPGASPYAASFNALSERLDQVEGRAKEKSAESMLAPSLFASGKTRDWPVFIAVVGLDRFSDLRRHMGAEMADRILQAVSGRIHGRISPALTGRIGRTIVEFAFPAESQAAATAQLEQLREDLEERLEVDGQTFDLGVAIGVAPRVGRQESVVENAAIALAHAQAGHIKVVAFCEEDREAALARLSLLGDLRTAIARDELFLCYQPKYRCRTGAVDVAEALIRWRHPVRGLVPPDEFIGLAEETGLITDLTKWVLSQAIADQTRLLAQGHAIALHVNISGRLVPDPAFADWALKTVAEKAVGVIGFEITETAVIDEPERALRNLEAFAKAGIKIAIDDYGSGLSSLAYLKQLPAHELKIDRMFISDLASSHRDPLLVRSTIDLAHALDMEVTAEGVDTASALALLRMMGCDLIQGYFISKPINIEELESFLRDDINIEIRNPFILNRPTPKVG